MATNQGRDLPIIYGPYRDRGFTASCRGQCAVGDGLLGQLWAGIRLGLYAAFG